MGATFGAAHPVLANLAKGGLGGLGQGLQQYGSQNPQFDFTKIQKGMLPTKPAMGNAITPNAKRVQDMNPFSQNPNWGGDYT